MPKAAASVVPTIYDANLAEEQAERLALRDAKTAMQAVIDGNDARLALINAASNVALLRVQVKDLAKLVVDQAREIKRLARVVGGADRA